MTTVRTAGKWTLLMAVLALSPALSVQAQQAPASAAASPAAPGEIVVAVKGQEPLRLASPPSRIAVADPEVADVKVLPAGPNRAGEVIIIGRKAGTTELRIWARGQRDPQLWVVRVATDVQAALATRGVQPGAFVDMAGGTGLVSGVAPSAEAHRGAVEAAGGDKNVVDVSQINTSGVVQVEVKVVEVSRTVMKDIGVSFNAGGSRFSGGVNLLPSLAGGFMGSISYSSRDFNATLQLLQSNGLARVLAEPTLLALSGQSASFLAGGEIPVPESGGLGTQNVVYKPFGIGLTVSPTVISRERIALKVAPEASELDYANGTTIVNSNNSTTIIPALRTRRADTMVELGDGESFLISGLVSRQTKANVSKIPLLGDLPIIGSFFRNVQYSQEDNELVIVVTPRLVRPIARGVTLPLPGARQEVTDSGFNAWGYYLLGPMGGQQMPGFSQ
ncbi:type II and III secretion system protein [Bordetella hinzii CA90 BAL1384]|nr:type II and III secretion system protein [Bordetella hinzii L60]KCB33918.1 type II and III secretion system protein [Bordetella hinzii CA90 BAL1384]KCB43166.1 type II and III secretion system protein [Bordetella hinzii 5132]KCB49748.1 type II and III secretion system protein [Bordetella hinzii 4161]KCB51180.1 type II and III secretion system protein [Bordetella hinzii 1277]QET43711.1 type II and III secretion system protein family protein [Bordetella hinzii]